MENQSESETAPGEKSGLLNEWIIFWNSLKSSNDFRIEAPAIENLSAKQAAELNQILSQDRRRTNQKIELINKEIKLNQSKLESLQMMGSEGDSILLRINELNDQGQKLSLELASLDEQLKKARDLENILCGNGWSPQR